MLTPATPEQEASQHLAVHAKHNGWILTIGIFKLLKAILFISLGVGAIHLLHKDLVDIFTRLALELRFDPEGRFVNIIIDKVALLNDHRLRQISAAIFAYAAVDIIEGVGLLLEKTWAEYLTLIITASFLPWELFEIVRHVTWIKIVLTIVNVAVVLYLVFYLKSRQQERDALR